MNAVSAGVHICSAVMLLSLITYSEEIPAAGGCRFLPPSCPLGPELSSNSPLGVACGGGPCVHLPLELVSH